MANWQRVLGQVLAAVGLTTAAGGIASFFWANVELRFLGDVLESDRARMIWVVVTLAMGVAGAAILLAGRKARHPRRDQVNQVI